MINAFNGTYFFLSNFYQHEVLFDGVSYPTNEHAFQAAKTLDVGARIQISELPNAGMAKQWGRRVQLRENWETYVRYEVMQELIRLKFSNAALGLRLTLTGTQMLVEGNTWGDRTWGQAEGSGHNLLGWMLMREREVLRG